MLFEVRFVADRYLNRVVYEEGPGSYSYIVSDKSSSSMELGKMSLAEAESLTRSDLEYMGCYFDENSDDGFEEYSHKLEYFDPTTDEWRYVTSVR